MRNRTDVMCRTARVAIVALGLVASGAGAARAGDDPDVRFHGPLTYDFGVTNVKWEAATKDYSYVTFDLSWSFSWRTKWTEPAATSCTGKDMEVENWDAAWVFVKFLPEKDSAEAKERNYWRHATLDTDPSHHVMPAGATNTVKLADDPSTALGAGGTRGMGVFIYRDAVGNGVNDFKNVKLRWQHTADGADPGKAAVRAYAIPMVYVPEGPFKIGVPAETGFSPFSDGPDIPKTRFDGEQNFKEIPEVLRNAIETTTSKDGGPYLRWTEHNQTFQFTDGAWRGGKAIPFLLDKEWNAPGAASPRSRRIGPEAGWFWGTHTFSERAGGSTFGGPLGGKTALNDDYPTGYDAFYCMKYDLTQGQYVDYLNSLPPDVAAGRAFVSSEEWATYGSPPSTTVKVKLASGREIEIRELAGNTIRSSADVPAASDEPPVAGASEMSLGEEEKDDGLGMLLDDTFADNTTVKKRADGAKIRKEASMPVYSARCPFRRLQGFCWPDIRAFAVWAGLRPMTCLEVTKAGAGALDPSAPPGPASSYDAEGDLVMADAGQPNERPIKGLSRYGADYGVRVGCFATPTSDRATARATYWGVTELGGMTVPLLDLKFRGSHGNGIMPAGKPGGSWKRQFAAFTNTPPDWGFWGEYAQGHRHANKICRLAVSADNRVRNSAGEVAMERKLAAQFPPADASRDDIPRVANVKVEPGKEYSTVSFDLAWQNSWRAKWEEPAEKNVTGKPLQVESWDAAWVFVKYRPVGARDDSPAMLATEKKQHQIPAGADLEVGLTDDGTRGVGVFVYRNAVGVGPNDFKTIKLRWTHSPSPGGSGATSGGAVDPTKGEVKVHAIAMVCIPEGPFASRSPWGHPLTIITTPLATEPGGNLDLGPEERPLSPDWPNGYTSFYCMKYSISQGQYAEMLNSAPSRKYKVARRFNALAHNNARLWHPKFYGFNGYTINTNAAGLFKADVPDRMCPLLTEADITFFTVWAGLRLMTDLEYEKACRGQRAVANGGDAWKPAACAPAAGLDKSVLAAPSAVGVGPSYWGIRELSLSGCVQEWPSVVAGAWGWGKKYEGTHSTGTMEDPDDWPWGWFANLYYGGIWRCPGYGTVGHWINADEYDRTPYELMDGERCGRYGARAVRTAPVATDENAPLQVDEIPNVAGYDVAIFQLSGTFRNDGDKPLKVELTSAVPDACFVDGAASRTFMARPKVVTPFQILTALTIDNAAVALRGGRKLTVQMRAAGGDLLSKQVVRLTISAPKDVKPTAIRSLEGGEIALRILNATDQPRTVVLALTAPQGVNIQDLTRSVTITAGGKETVAFRIPRQAFPVSGVQRMPCRVVVGNGAPQSAVVIADLQPLTRWWLGRHIEKGPALGEENLGGYEIGGAFDVGDIMEDDRPSGMPADLFTRKAPPKDWKETVCGETSIPLSSVGALPGQGASAIAATHVISPTARETVVGMKYNVPKTGEGPSARELRVTFRVWINGLVVYDSRKGETGGAKPFTLKKGANTVAVSCRSDDTVAVAPGDVSVRFLDAGNSKPVGGLILDIKPNGK